MVFNRRYLKESEQFIFFGFAGFCAISVQIAGGKNDNIMINHDEHLKT